MLYFYLFKLTFLYPEQTLQTSSIVTGIASNWLAPHYFKINFSYNTVVIQPQKIHLLKALSLCYFKFIEKWKLISFLG